MAIKNDFALYIYEKLPTNSAAPHLTNKDRYKNIEWFLEKDIQVD